MKEIIFTNHAERRRKQRGITPIDIAFIIAIHKSKKIRADGKTEIIGVAYARTIKVVYIEEENYLKIITIM